MLSEICLQISRSFTLTQKILENLWVNIRFTACSQISKRLSRRLIYYCINVFLFFLLFFFPCYFSILSEKLCQILREMLLVFENSYEHHQMTSLSLLPCSSHLAQIELCNLNLCINYSVYIYCFIRLMWEHQFI